MELNSMLCGGLHGSGFWGRMDTHECTAESLHCPPETIRTLLVGYTPTQYNASLVAQLVKNPPEMRETWVQSLGWEDPLEKGKATHSSSLTWRIPCPWGHKELDNDWATFTFYSNTKLKKNFFLIFKRKVVCFSYLVPQNECLWESQQALCEPHYV